MSDYLVRWEINIEAYSAQEAAQIALQIQRDQGSEATWFRVQAEDGATTFVDLCPYD